jgi:hypothetical protein
MLSAPLGRCLMACGRGASRPRCIHVQGQHRIEVDKPCTPGATPTYASPRPGPLAEMWAIVRGLSRRRPREDQR